MKKFLISLFIILCAAVSCTKSNELKISKTTENIACTGGNISFQITANCSWEITSEELGKSCFSQTSGSGDATITIAVPENDKLGKKTITVKVACGSDTIQTLTITQEASPEAKVSFTDVKENFDFEGGTITGVIEANAAWTATVPEGFSIEPASGDKNAEFTLTVPANTGNEDIKFTLTVTAKNAAGEKSHSQTFTLEKPSVDLGGVTYKVVKMKDGRWWMAENLRYVPDGKTVSSTPGDKSGLWYPCKSSTDKTADTSNEAVEQKGLLYNTSVAFGSEVNPDTYKNFEGTQGICPKGWHIPTALEAYNLCGNMNNVNDEESIPYKGTTNLPTINEDGMNLIPYCYVNATKASAAGTYIATLGTDKNPGMGYWMTSTPKKALPAGSPTNYKGTIEEWKTWEIDAPTYETDGSLKNIQFYGMMTNRVSGNDKLSVAFTSFMSGTPIRCIKDQKN